MRNRHAMKLFMAAIGEHTLVAERKPTHFDQFRSARFEAMEKRHRTRGWKWNEEKVKRGVNKDLENIRTIEFAEALSLVSTVLGAGKDTLARTYVTLASKSHAHSLNVPALFAGTEGEQN